MKYLTPLLKLMFPILFTLQTWHGFSQSQLEEYGIDEIYQKVNLESGSLDQRGRRIDYVFVKTELDQGKYEVEITDGPGDLYHVKGTNYYLEFRSYYGYAGYGDEGILEIGYTNWSSTFYKFE